MNLDILKSQKLRNLVYCLRNKTKFRKKNVRARKLLKSRVFVSEFKFQKKKKEFFAVLASLNVNKRKRRSKVANLKDYTIFTKRRLNYRILDNRRNFLSISRNWKKIKKTRKIRRTRKYKKVKSLPRYKFFTKELLRKNPLTRFYRSNLSTIAINYSLLLSFHTAIGNSFKTWVNPAMFSTILAVRNDMILYDLTNVILKLKKGLQNLVQVSKMKGTILGFIDLSKNYKFSKNGFDHFVRIWLPGYLTNFKSVMKNLLGLTTKNFMNLTRRQTRFLDNIIIRRRAFNSSKYIFFKLRRAYQRKRGKKTKNRIPAIPKFGFSIEDHFIWLNESHKIGMKNMAICDSESFPQKLDYPLIGNQKSLPFTFFVVKMVRESIISGKRFDYFSFIGFNYMSKLFSKNNFLN